MSLWLQGYKFHVVGGDKLIAKIMGDEGAYESGLRDSDFVIFSGGTDIQPSMYNEFAVHPCTDEPDRERDAYERTVYSLTMRKKLRIGICRGAQLLCALNGGKLYQHVSGHLQGHKMIYTEKSGNKRVLNVTSSHHQMMIVPKGGEIWGCAGTSTFKYTGYATQEASNMPAKHQDDPEIVYFKGSRSLCFQPHPEWPGSAGRKLFFECIDRALKTK